MQRSARDCRRDTSVSSECDRDSRHRLMMTGERSTHAPSVVDGPPRFTGHHAEGVSEQQTKRVSACKNRVFGKPAAAGSDLEASPQGRRTMLKSNIRNRISPAETSRIRGPRILPSHEILRAPRSQITGEAEHRFQVKFENPYFSRQIRL